MIKAAVAIPTYKRPKALRNALESIAQQKVDSAFSVRIIVINNFPDVPVEPHIADIASAYPISIMNEHERGFSSARNRAVMETEEDEALIFIDDDCVAEPGWLNHLLNCWINHQADLVTGTWHHFLYNPNDDDEKSFDKDRLRKIPFFVRGGDYKTGTEIKFINMANLLISPGLIKKLGKNLFNKSLNINGCEDLYFCWNVKDRAKIVWCQEAMIKEYWPYERAYFRHLLDKSFTSGSNYPVAWVDTLGVFKGIAYTFYKTGKLLAAAGFNGLKGLIFFNKHLLIDACCRAYTAAGILLGLVGLKFSYRKNEAIHIER